MPDATHNFLARLVAYNPNGASLGILPGPGNTSAQFPVMDTASLTFDYQQFGVRANLMGSPREFALEVSSEGSVWYERGPRFLYLADSRDYVQPNGRWQVTCPGYDFVLTKAKVYGPGTTSGTWDPATGPRELGLVTPGAILKTFIDEAKTRGGLAGLTVTGLANLATQIPSTGGAWPTTVERSYAQGTSVRQVLQDLADERFLDWEIVGRTLTIYPADGLQDIAMAWGSASVSDERTTLNPSAQTEAPTVRTWEGCASHLLQEGETGIGNVAADGTPVQPWGRWEEYSTHGGVDTTAALADLATKHFAANRGPLVDTTVTVNLSTREGKGSRPLLDAKPGQRVQVRLPLGAPYLSVVKSMSLAQKGAEWVGHFTLDRRSTPADVKAAVAIRQRDRSVLARNSEFIASTGPPPAPVGKWYPITLTAGWSATGGWTQPGIRRLADGTLELRGLVGRTGAASGANNVMATIGVDHRPEFFATVARETLVVGGAALGNWVYLNNTNGQLVVTVAVATGNYIDLGCHISRIT